MLGDVLSSYYQLHLEKKKKKNTSSLVTNRYLFWQKTVSLFFAELFHMQTKPV